MDEEQISEHLECSVCLERFDQSCKVLPCQHTFCRQCLDEIILKKQELRCPECRALVTVRVSDLPTNILVVRILEGLKTKYQRSAGGSIKQHGPWSLSSSPSKGEVSAQLPVHDPISSHSYRQGTEPCAKALYNYDSSEKDDLTFRKGDVVVLRRKIDDNWFQGEIDGRLGYFPAYFVQVLIPLPQIPQWFSLYDFELRDEGEKDCLPLRKGESTLSVSEYSSTESGKREQPSQTLNQVINENVSNREELSITNITSAYQLSHEIPNQQLGSSAKGNNLCRRLSKENLNSDKITSETPHDVSKPTFESSIEGSQVDTRSIPPGSSDSTKNSTLDPCKYRSSAVNWHNAITSKTIISDERRRSTLDPAKSSSPRLYPILRTFEPSTSGQDFIKYRPMYQVDHNTNNSSLRKCTRNPESETELLDSESVSSSEPESQSLWIKDASIYLTLVLLIAVLYSMLLSSTPSSDDSPLEKFSTYVHEIRLTFPSQDQTFWKTLESSSHRILKQDVSKYPAVILMASSLKHASVALGIARNISSAFDLSVGLSSDSSVINLEDYKHLSGAEQKLQLYNVLDSVLGKRRSVVLENLQRLDPLAALLFYNYCDNDYAPFKDVLIILNLYFDDEKEKIDDPIAVENHLEMIWNKGLASDKVKPLLSRVANHVVIVQGESPDVK